MLCASSGTSHGLNSFAGLDGLELAQVPDPVPRDGEQLVKVRAASLGPWDRYSTEGAFVAMGGSSEFPQVQGWDFAGQTIDGRRVLGFVPQPWMGVGRSLSKSPCRPRSLRRCPKPSASKRA